MHYARLEKSGRLQRVLALLSDGLPRTTREIVRGADVCAVNSIVTEIRANGYDIDCRCIGRGLFEYRLVSRPTDDNSSSSCEDLYRR